MVIGEVMQVPTQGDELDGRRRESKAFGSHGTRTIGTSDDYSQRKAKRGRRFRRRVAEETGSSGSLAEFLLASPMRGADLDLERQHDEPRDPAL